MRRFKKALFLLLMIAANSVAQKTAILKGSITEQNRLFLSGATITLEDIDMYATSDENGKYLLTNVPFGNHKMIITYMGYDDLKEEITIDKPTVIRDFELQAKTSLLNKVVVIGNYGETLVRALNKQQSNINVTNVIYSDQVGKFPDSNIGDALKRVTGISVQNDQGEARDIIVRGIAPQLNSVTLNGDRLPSAEGYNRRVQMDLIPSDMVQSIQVNKAVTPDMEGDAIGGSVNLITRTAPTGFRAYVTTYGGLNYRGKTRTYLSALAANRFFKKKLGAYFSGSYQNNAYYSDNVEFVWAQDNNKDPYIKQNDIRRYSLDRMRLSASANLDYELSPKHTLFLKTIYNRRFDWENRFRLRFKNDPPNGNGISESKIQRQTKGGSANQKNTRLEDQQVYKIALSGKHIFFNDLKTNWKIAYSRASENRPNERYITYQKKDLITRQNTDRELISPVDDNFNDPASLELKELLELQKNTFENNTNAQIKFKYPLIDEGKYKSTLKTGYKINIKDKERNNTQSDYAKYAKNTLSIATMDKTAFADKTLSDFIPGSRYKSGNFVEASYLGSIDLQGVPEGDKVLELSKFVPKNYRASEVVNAVYAMMTQQLGKHWELLGGLRIEHTQMKYVGNQIDEDTAKSLNDVTQSQGKVSYSNFLPNIHVKYTSKKSKQWVLRLAYTKTIARPNYYDLVPFKSIQSSDNEATYGNSQLKTARSHNLDFMTEYYIKPLGLISAGVFYKNILDFVYRKREQKDLTLGGVTSTYTISKPLNGNRANVYGIEIGLQQKLQFLPSFLANFVVYGNYTYTGSKTRGVANRESTSLPGAIPQMFNFSLAYETSKILARVALNHADSYIDEYGTNTFLDRYYDQQTFVDVNANYNITKKFSVFIEGKNLTNQPLRYYQGNRSRTMQAEFYGVSGNLGIKYNF